MACGPLVGNRLDSYGQRVNDVPALPSGPLAAASLSIVQATASAPIADHSIRTFLYARLLAEHESSLNDAAYDEDLRAAGREPITTEVEPAAPFYYAEEHHQQYLHKVPNGYCGLAGTGVSCRIPTAAP